MTHKPLTARLLTVGGSCLGVLLAPAAAGAGGCDKKVRVHRGGHNRAVAYGPGYGRDNVTYYDVDDYDLIGPAPVVVQTLPVYRETVYVGPRPSFGLHLGFGFASGHRYHKGYHSKKVSHRRVHLQRAPVVRVDRGWGHRSDHGGRHGRDFRRHGGSGRHFGGSDFRRGHHSLKSPRRGPGVRFKRHHD